MKKTVLVLGVDGYIGHAMTLRLLESGYKVLGVDDFQRRKHVEEMKSFSAIEIQSPEERHNIFRSIGDFEFRELSIHKDFEEMCDFMKDEDISTVLNLAQQPSAPFSMKSRKHAVETLDNNNTGTLNILYMMKEFAPDAHLVQIGTMGEYGTPNVDIPEGTFDLEFRGRVAKDVLFPRCPASWYHATKVHSTYLIDAAFRWWKLNATDIMQGVLYGNWTPEIEKYNCPTRLDSDEGFGTAINRFVVQALIDEPMTAFGDGLQQRGYLSLNDSCQCLMLAIENPAKGYRTWNQLDIVYTIMDLTKEVADVCAKHGIETSVVNIWDPRVERTDFFHYVPDTNKLKKLGFDPTRRVADDVDYIVRILKDKRDELYPLKEVVIPKILWRELNPEDEIEISN